MGNVCDSPFPIGCRMEPLSTTNLPFWYMKFSLNVPGISPGKWSGPMVDFIGINRQSVTSLQYYMVTSRKRQEKHYGTFQLGSKEDVGRENPRWICEGTIGKLSSHFLTDIFKHSLAQFLVRWRGCETIWENMLQMHNFRLPAWMARKSFHHPLASHVR